MLHSHCANNVFVLIPSSVSSNQFRQKVGWSTLCKPRTLKSGVNTWTRGSTAQLTRDLDTQTWLIYYEDIPANQKKILGWGFHKLEHEQDRQTHRQTDATERITSHTRG